eukprot:TRINITY_DN13721_c0_g1_i1.p1 TRINITY_DN13721_c0_g1~~TRINITY_DN13721_c0_g1_i1.p1  ORF type:complete len:322 (-),score=66.58 TRINITY_DN13721_c0_g1_i1:16-981(-)
MNKAKQFYFNNKLYVIIFLLFMFNGIFFFTLGTRYAKYDDFSVTDILKYNKIRITDDRNKELIVAKSAFAPHFDFLAHNLQYSKYVSKSFKENGLWESPQSGFIEDVFKNIAPKDSSFIEVGASIGWFCMLVANTGHYTYAIEPYTYNLEVFRANLALNPQFGSNVHVINKAVLGPDHKPKVCLIPYYSPNKENEENAQPNPRDEKCDHPSGELVEVSTIDKELLNIVDKKPFLMNFDVEGFEFDALKGAEKFLKKFTPCYLIVDMDHVSNFGGTDSDTITKWLKNRGYDLCLHSVDRDKLYQHNSCTMYSSKLQECESYG